VNEVAVLEQGGYLTRLQCSECHEVHYDPPALAGVVDDSGVPFTDPLLFLMNPIPGPAYTLPVISTYGTVVQGKHAVWSKIPGPGGYPTLYGFVVEERRTTSAGRWAAVVIAGLVLGPLCLAAGAVAALALLTEFFTVDMTDLLPRDLPGALDWLAGGPGAGPGSFQRYLTLIVSAVIAGATGAAIVATWRWARS